MTGFYDITENLRAHLQADIDVNTVTFGELSFIASAKHVMYGLCHITAGIATYNGSTVTIPFDVFAMDKVDINKDATTNQFRGNDNLHDVLNTQLAVLVRMYDSLRRGDLNANGFHLVAGASMEPFTDRFEDSVAGWTGSFAIEVRTDMTIC